jgi:hypothetical protein
MQPQVTSSELILPTYSVPISVQQRSRRTPSQRKIDRCRLGEDFILREEITIDPSALTYPRCDIINSFNLYTSTLTTLPSANL